MSPISRWTTARHRRKEGHAELSADPPRTPAGVPVESFEPELGRDERQSAMYQRIAHLGSESVDEATGHAVDNFINRQGDDWRRRLHQQQAAWYPRARYRLGQAAALVRRNQVLYEQDLVALRHAEIALEAALLSLGENEPLPSAQNWTNYPPATGAWDAEETAGPAADDFMADDQPLRDGSAGRPSALEADRVQRGWPDIDSVLASPRVSRPELTGLLSPRDASRVPRWSDRDFRDATLLAGRPRGAFIHAIALILAAGADIGAFVQVVELILPQGDWVSWIVVTGLTAVVLYLAHMVGVIIREARAAGPRDSGISRRGRGLAAALGTAIWLGVGGLAFWVRLTVPLIGTVQLGGGGIGTGSSGSGGIGTGGIGSGSSGIGTTSTANPHPLQAAAIFLGLYLATGAVAAIGAYFTHNPHRGTYAAAARAYRRASEHAAASTYRLLEAISAYGYQEAEITAAGWTLSDADAQNSAFIRQLKQSARIQIAGLAKDPAVTDAFFDPDDDQPPHGSGAAGNHGGRP